MNFFFSPDGHLLCSIGDYPESLMTLWNWKDAKILKQKSLYGNTVTHIEFSLYSRGHLTTGGKYIWIKIFHSYLLKNLYFNFTILSRKWIHWILENWRDIHWFKTDGTNGKVWNAKYSKHLWYFLFTRWPSKLLL